MEESCMFTGKDKEIIENLYKNLPDTLSGSLKNLLGIVEYHLYSNKIFIEDRVLLLDFLRIIEHLSNFNELIKVYDQLTYDRLANQLSFTKEEKEEFIKWYIQLLKEPFEQLEKFLNQLMEFSNKLSNQLEDEFKTPIEKHSRIFDLWILIELIITFKARLIDFSRQLEDDYLKTWSKEYIEPIKQLNRLFETLGDIYNKIAKVLNLPEGWVDPQNWKDIIEK
jgi:hypothetical protein